MESDKEENARAGWILRHWPIVLVGATGLAWGVRLEERLDNHLDAPFHDGMRSTRDDFIYIKAELRF